MTGRITRLIEDQQFGTIAAEDGQDYVFQSIALTQTTFRDRSLGAVVTFEPIDGLRGIRRASGVRRLEK